MQETLDRSRAWRDSIRAAEILDLDTSADPVPQLTDRQLLRILQDLIPETQQDKKQLNTVWRLVLDGTHPGLIIGGDDHAGPE